MTASLASTPARLGQVPAVSALLLRWFTWYARRYVRRHFHAVRLSPRGVPPGHPNLPLIVYANHPSWWDPLVCLVLKAEFYSERTAFAPMDAAMLQRYRFFGRLGFFGVEPRRVRGAAQFLRTAEAILQSPEHLLALTPQGRFVDVRQRPLRFAPGLGHLAARIQGGCFIPMALEYVFWEERLPEILVRFGEMVEVRRETHGVFEPEYWTRLFEAKLSEVQDALAREAQRRSPKEFLTVLRGGAGQGGVYDAWRWCRAQWTGATFQKEHRSL